MKTPVAFVGSALLLGLVAPPAPAQTTDPRPSTLMFAKFSPDGRRVGYVRENNIYVEDLAGGEVTQVTRDGSPTLVNGTFDWVYEEELDRRAGRPAQPVTWHGWTGPATRTRLCCSALNRLQNTLDVMIGDAATGRARTILTERDEAWVDVDDDFRWLAEGRRFTWVSERDGWRHVYTFGRSGDGMTLLTPGGSDVIQLREVDERGGFVYYIASPDNPTQRYRASTAPLAGAGAGVTLAVVAGRDRE